MKQTRIGGQAVIEGVMMRGRAMYCMAVRNPQGTLTVEKKAWKGLSSKGVFRLPILRGIASFWDSLVSGTRILMRSAEIAGEGWEDEEPSKLEKFLIDKFGEKVNDILIYVTVIISMAMGIGLFFLLPVLLGSFFSCFVPSWALGIIESFIRIAIFLGYLFAISRMKEIQRVFQYHGAEHKTINCFESEKELTVENVRPCTRLHKRCGTSFLFFVIIISCIVFMFIQTTSVGDRLLLKLCLVPFIAGISYEVIRWAGNSDSPLVAIVSKPGFCLQMLTTAEPDDSQIEAAIAAMKGVLEDEGEQ